MYGPIFERWGLQTRRGEADAAAVSVPGGPPQGQSRHHHKHHTSTKIEMLTQSQQHQQQQQYSTKQKSHTTNQQSHNLVPFQPSPQARETQPRELNPQHCPLLVMQRGFSTRCMRPTMHELACHPGLPWEILPERCWWCWDGGGRAQGEPLSLRPGQQGKAVQVTGACCLLRGAGFPWMFLCAFCYPGVLKTCDADGCVSETNEALFR